MQIDIPDPAYTSSERTRANFRLAAKIALGFVALLWVIQLLNWATVSKRSLPADRWVFTLFCFTHWGGPNKD